MYRRLLGALLALGALIASGCNAVGPAVLGSGRAAYGEVLTDSSNEQLLRAIVLDRFSEATVLMAVSSVTANVTLHASASSQFGFGPQGNYSGNLVPLGVGIAYEENPTISYVPVDAPRYIRQLMSPITLEQALLLIRGATNKKLALCMLIERINGLTNPTLAGDPSEESSDFTRVAQLISNLSQAGVADLVSISEGGYGILIRVREIPDRAELEELLKLLNLTDLLSPWGGIKTGMAGSARKKATAKSSPPDASHASSGSGDSKDTDSGLAKAETDVIEGSRSDFLVIPVRFSAASDGSSIAVMTRSVYDLVRLASSTVDVPDDQIERGMAPPTATFDPDRALVQIKRATHRPEHALVTTKTHGYWYYIDEGDYRSKEYFRLLTGMWTAQMAESKVGFQAPVLTVGVSK